MSETGAFFIPTPLGYIDENNTAERVLSRLEGFTGLASMFYHPFREFPFLQPETGSSGKPVFRGGLPVFRYRPGVESDLQKLVRGFRQQGYGWVSLYRVLPRLVWLQLPACLSPPPF